MICEECHELGRVCDKCRKEAINAAKDHVVEAASQLRQEIHQPCKCHVIGWDRLMEALQALDELRGGK